MVRVGPVRSGAVAAAAAPVVAASSVAPAIPVARSRPPAGVGQWSGKARPVDWATPAASLPLALNVTVPVGPPVLSLIVAR